MKVRYLCAVELTTGNEIICSFIVNNGQFHCYRFYDDTTSTSRKKNKDKEERAEGICAGMHNHFEVDNEMTLEMHWDIGNDNFCKFELGFF